MYVVRYAIGIKKMEKGNPIYLSMGALLRLKHTLEEQGVRFEYREEFYGVGYSDAYDYREVSIGEVCFAAEELLYSFYSEGGEDANKEYFSYLKEASQQGL